MSIIQRVPWTVQPQVEVGINYGNPLTAGLTSVVKGRGSPLRNQISNSVLGTTGTVSTGATGPFGLAGNAATEAGNSSWQDGLSGTLLSTTGATVLAIVKKTDGTNRQSALFYHGDATAGTPSNFFNLHFPWSDGSVYADFGGFSGSNRISYAGQSFGTALLVIFSAGAGGSRILVNGVVKASQTSALTRTDGNTTTQWNQYLPAATEARSDRINLTLGCVWRRELSLDECLALSDNPWQIFAPQTRRIWAPSAGVTSYTLTCAPGSFALTGAAATLKFNRLLSAASGAFALTGTATSLQFNRLLSAASGAFALTGTAATLTYNPVGSSTLTAASGSFSLAGTATTLKANRILTAASGSFALTGTAASIRANHVLAANSGSIVLTGTAVMLTWSGAGSTTLTAADLAAIDALITAQLPNIAAAVLAAYVEGTTTVQQALRLYDAVLGGKVSGAGTNTETFRDLADTKDRIVATVDTSGNRTAVTRDLS